jgi:hypothetical protein
MIRVTVSPDVAMQSTTGRKIKLKSLNRSKHNSSRQEKLIAVAGALWRAREPATCQNRSARGDFRWKSGSWPATTTGLTMIGEMSA